MKKLLLIILTLIVTSFQTMKAQDIIQNPNGSQINIKILEQNSKGIKYVLLGKQNSDTFNIPISMISSFFDNVIYIKDTVKHIPPAPVKKEYNSWIRLTQKDEFSEGKLINTLDSGLNFKFKLFKEPQNINVSEIDEIKFRNSESIGNGVLKGSILGFIAGGLIGLGTNEINNLKGYGYSQYNGIFFLMGGIIGVVPGCIIGVSIGSSYIKIPINGNQNTYQQHLNKIKKYSLLNN